MKHWLKQHIAALVIIAIPIMSFAYLGSNHAQPFDLHFSPFICIPMIAIITNLVVLVLIEQSDSHADENLWFSLMSVATAIWSIGIMFQILSNSPTAALFWLDFSTLGWVAIPATTLLGVYAYTHPGQPKSYSLTSSLFGGSMIFLFINLYTNLFTTRDLGTIRVTSMGIITRPGPAAPLLIVWVEGIFLTALLLLIRKYRRTKDRIERKQLGFFMFALSIPLAGSTISEVLLPRLFDFHPIFLVSSYYALTAAVITYAILRFRLFIFNPTSFTFNLLKTIDDMVIGVRPDLTVNYMNRSAEALLGRYVEHRVNRLTLTNIFGIEVMKHIRKELIEPLSTTTIVSNRAELALHVPNGETLSVTLAASRIMSDRGEFQGYVLVMTDITSLKQAQKELQQEKSNIERKVAQRTRELQKSQAQLLASIGSLPFGFAIIDQEQHIILANSILPKLIGMPIPSEPLQTQEVLQHIAKKYSPTIKLLRDIAHTQEKQVSIERIADLEGRSYRFLFTPVVQQIGHNNVAIGTVMIIGDITEQKAQERSRDEFFSIASHELRTPLTAIRGNADMILRFYSDQIKDHDAIEMVTDIHDASMRLITIVNDFLDVSRLEQKRLAFKIEPLDIPDLMTQILREYEVTGSRNKLSLEMLPVTETIPKAYADKDRAKQILINLISNAIKYTKQGGVSIRVTTTGKKVKISVIDTGQGIPEESIPMLFHKFQQASNNTFTRDNTRSTGLGLYISQMMAAGMKGKLYLEATELNHGSTFTLELPTIPHK